MTPAFEKLQQQLKQLPGLGYRSAERIALHLLVEKPAQLAALVTALEAASRSVRRCERCGNLAALQARLAAGEVAELILALSNDVEGEATCHYLTEQLPPAQAVKVTRIGFGLPSGGGVLYADSVTLKSALDGRRSYS
jgi:recombination protein RecR